MESAAIANLSRDELVSRVQHAEQLVSKADEAQIGYFTSLFQTLLHLCDCLCNEPRQQEGCPTVLLVVQLQQEQRRSNSLTDELRAAKEQNVLVV